MVKSGEVVDVVGPRILINSGKSGYPVTGIPRLSRLDLEFEALIASVCSDSTSSAVVRRRWPYLLPHQVAVVGRGVILAGVALGSRVAGGAVVSAGPDRSHLLPEERAAGSDDPRAQAEAILAESEERTEHPDADDPQSGRRTSSELT